MRANFNSNYFINHIQRTIMSFCRNCSAQLLDDWKFCNKCGVSVDETIPIASRKKPKKEMSTFKIVAITVLVVIGIMILKVLLRLLF